MLLNRSALPHTHYASAQTSANLGHTHFLELFTYPANGNAGDRHTHRFQGITAVCRRCEVHFHRIVGTTSPAIPLGANDHYHRIEGYVDEEPFIFLGGSYKTNLQVPPHVHFVRMNSSGVLGEEPEDW